MTELDLYTGKCGRVCPECNTEIEIERPTRPIGRDSTRTQRHAYSLELRRQILWEATCEGSDGCRAFWNSVVLRAERGPEASC